MNYFNIDVKINDLLTANGAFFAFTEQQYNDEALPGVEYKRLYAGMLCPSDNVTILIQGYLLIMLIEIIARYQARKQGICISLLDTFIFV